MGKNNAAFEVIPRHFDGCVYAVQLSNGVVKVGFSRNPRTRMCSLSDQVRRKFGVRLTKFHVGDNLPALEALRVETRIKQPGPPTAHPLLPPPPHFS